jgi:CBS domain-containing protein
MLMPGSVIDVILRDFARLTPSDTVAEARRKLDETARWRNKQVGYGVVVDAAGQPLTCLRNVLLSGWPAKGTLAAQHDRWPELVTLPDAEALAAPDIIVLARFFSDVLHQDRELPGVVLLDERGWPAGVLTRRDLLAALLAGEGPTDDRGERNPSVPYGLPSDRELLV